MSRPSKLTAASQELFLQAISAGAFPEVAARHAGFSPASLYRYMSGSRPEHAAFRDAVQTTIATLELRLVGTVTRAALDDPRWAMALLERRFAERWRIRSQPDEVANALVDPADQPDHDVVTLDPALAEALLPRLLEAGARLRNAAAADPVDLDRFVDREDAEAATDEEQPA